MKTVKTYMVRKPADIEEVRNLTQQYAHQAEEVVIAETVHLSPTWYQAVCQRPLDKSVGKMICARSLSCFSMWYPLLLGTFENE